MELADYVRMLRHHWKAVVGTVIVSVVVAFLYSSMQPRMYAATSSGFVTFGPTADATLASANDLLSKSRAASYVGLAKDGATASIVIADLDLDTTPEALVSEIEVTQAPETVLINVTARAETAEGAQQLADSWISALAQRVSDIESVDGDQGLRVEVAKSALLPTSPVSPLVGRNVLLSAILGALLGAGYAIVRTVLERRLRSADEVESASGVSVLGSVPELGKTDGLFVGAGEASRSARAAEEEIRRLRTNLAYMDVSGHARSIVVTSPSEDDGKTTVAINLAAALILGGQQVTLVDADLRDSAVARTRGLDAGVGLTEVLRGEVELDAALQSDPDISGLKVLTAGHRPDNPSELLSSDAMRSLIETLAGRGVVIIDTPALLPVTDAAVVAHLADGALIVVRVGAARRTELETTVDHLRAVHARPLGVVLNRTRQRMRVRRFAARDGDGHPGSTQGDRADTDASLV